MPSTRRPRAQLAFKNSMVHGILQFTPGIAFCYVLHRCESQDICCRESCWLRHQLGPGWLGGMDAAAVAVPSSGDVPVSGVRTLLGLGCVCKRSRGSPRCLPREEVELEGRAGSTATSTGGGDAARRSVHTEIPVQCGVGVGEEEVDGALDSKAKPWRQLAEVEWRQKSISSAAQGHGAAE